MSVETAAVDEEIRVGAAFDKGKAKPVWFLWRSRYYKIGAINFAWSSNIGSAKLRHYSVTVGSNMYELCFNSLTLEWTLSKVCSG
ncbi:MAG: hypothetical protein ABFD83_08270 [Armatimonadota bacterium]